METNNEIHNYPAEKKIYTKVQVITLNITLLKKEFIPLSLLLVEIDLLIQY